MSALSSIWYSLVGAFIGALPSLLLSRRLLRLERLSMQDPLTGLRSGRMLDGDVDLLSRSGPIALLSIRDERQALITAQRLCVALRDNGTPASIGVAYCDGSTDPRACELLADASANKEKAKKAGKNRVYPSPFDDDPPPPVTPQALSVETSTTDLVLSSDLATA